MKLSPELEAEVMKLAEVAPPRPIYSEQQGAFLSEINPKDKAQRQKARRKARSNSRQGRDKVFDALCISHGLPVPVQEYAFAPWEGGRAGCEHLARMFTCPCGAKRRSWRFDYLFEGWLAAEKVGGVWVKGHHSRGQSQIDDMERQNEAVILGYSLLSFTPQQFDSGEAFTTIKRALGAREHQS